MFSLVPNKDACFLHRGYAVIVDYNPWDARIEFDLRSSRVISKYM